MQYTDYLGAAGGGEFDCDEDGPELAPGSGGTGVFEVGGESPSKRT